MSEARHNELLDRERDEALLAGVEMLLSPFSLRNLELKNRVVLLPTGTGYTNRGRVEDEDIAYNVRRARGGVGLIITGGTTAHSTSQSRGRVFIEAFEPGVIPGLRARTELVHEEGAKIFGQLFNLGRHHASEVLGGVPLAPSAIRSHLYPYSPMSANEEEIDYVVEGFARSAVHLKEGGCDGLEIHAAHGYLLAQFLSRATNLRDDRYGGSMANRARLLLETVRAVRSAVGGEMVIGVRLSVDDEVPNGTGPSECVATIGLLEHESDVDYLSLAIGVRGGYVKDSSVADGVALDRMAAVKRETQLPVIVSQRIRRPEEAERALREGKADLVGMARALIADPDWVLKAQRGESERIRLCVGDLQDCRNHLSGGLACMVNADVGRQHGWDLSSRQSKARRQRHQVSVVGGGPAGLESARRAGELGHSVTLYEASDSLGGQIRLAASCEGRGDLLDFVKYQEQELRRLNVRVEFDAVIGDIELSALSSDVFVFATGAVGGALNDSMEPTRTISVWDSLLEPECSYGEVVILDDGWGDWPMLTAAERLSRAGNEVTIATVGSSLTRTVPAESLAGVRERLRLSDVGWITGVTNVILGDNTVTLDLDGGRDRVALGARIVVRESGRQPLDSLWRKAGTSLPREAVWFAVGDCRTPRGVGHAVSDALEFEKMLVEFPTDPNTVDERHYVGGHFSQ